MQRMFDVEAWREILVRGFGDLAREVATFLPNLVGALLILLVGWGVARASEAIASRLLHALGLDRVSTRIGLAGLFDRAEIRLTLSGMVARLIFWVLLLVFLLSGIETLGVEAVSLPIQRVIAFIPRLVGAILITILGLLLARFVGTLVSSGAAAAGFETAPRLGYLAQLLVAGLVLVAAVEQLGINSDVLLLPFTVLIGAAGFSVGLAFALGARPLVTHILAGHFLKRSLPRDAAVEVAGRRGMVERVGATETVIRGEEGAWSVPNAKLLEEVVQR